MEAINQLYKLIYTRERSSIELAVYLAQSQDIDLVGAYRALWDWLVQYAYINSCYIQPSTDTDLIELLSFWEELNLDIGQQVYYNSSKFSLMNGSPGIRHFYYEQLPDSIAYLHFLKRIYIVNPKLKKLPDIFSKIPFLEKIDVRTGMLRTIPTSIFQLPKLKELSISWNSLKEIPTELLELTQLEVLNLSYNNLQQLPEAIGQLSKLRILDLRGNQLQSIPDSLFELTRIRRIHLEENPISPELLKKVKAFSQMNWELLEIESNYLHWEDYFDALMIGAIGYRPMILEEELYIHSLFFEEGGPIALPNWLEEVQDDYPFHLQHSQDPSF